MNNSRSTLFFSLPGRYATALLEQEKASFSNQFKKIIDVLEYDHHTHTLLSSRHLDKKQLISFMDKISEILDLSKTFTNFLKLLIQENRLSLLPEIHKYYEKLWNQKNNTLHAIIYSATKLDKETKEKVEKKLTQSINKKLLFKYEVNDSLLGGILVDLDGVRIDATILNQINAIEKKLKVV